MIPDSARNLAVSSNMTSVSESNPKMNRGAMMNPYAAIVVTASPRTFTFCILAVSMSECWLTDSMPMNRMLKPARRIISMMSRCLYKLIVSQVNTEMSAPTRVFHSIIASRSARAQATSPMKLSQAN